MDSRGWIPVSLIASFNRVTRLTTDVQVVRDVLTLSSMVEVRDDWVRPISWQQFVFPDAVKSTVEIFEDPHQNHAVEGQGGLTRHESENGDFEAEGEEIEEEEDDVVFVMGST